MVTNLVNTNLNLEQHKYVTCGLETSLDTKCHFEHSITFHVDIDELRKDDRHAPRWRPDNGLEHDRDDGFLQDVCQGQFAVTVVRHHILGRDAGDEQLWAECTLSE